MQSSWLRTLLRTTWTHWNRFTNIHLSYHLSYHEHPDAIYGFTGQSAVRINNVTAYAPEASSVLDKTIRKPKKMMPGAISLNSGASTPPTHHIGGVGGGGGVEILKHTTPNLSTGRSGYVISGFTYTSTGLIPYTRPGTFLLASGHFSKLFYDPY